jgi:hypothetical protein
MMNFLSVNNITDYNDLVEKLRSMISKQRDISTQIKPIERRIKDLDEHIRQGENYKKYKGIYERYNSIEPSLTDKIFKRDPKADFYREHDTQIILFESADKYLKEHLNGKVKTPPLKKWKAEREEKTADKERLYKGYYALKEEVKEVEQIKKSVYEILRREEPQKQHRKSHNMEL